MGNTNQSDSAEWQYTFEGGEIVEVRFVSFERNKYLNLSQTPRKRSSKSDSLIPSFSITNMVQNRTPQAYQTIALAKENVTQGSPTAIVGATVCGVIGGGVGGAPGACVGLVVGASVEGVDGIIKI
eukprot:TRINITY_DN1103_c0_g1_i5.p1 TRINITY_DN1103_c0_g1~~TRINITY_DN1103_c0_g1_i5.p1  ORF type:complete len:126 (+),score=20.40 TRINITY_DN1103_c0_g1_i5:93-470(+)